MKDYLDQFDKEFILGKEIAEFIDLHTQFSDEKMSGKVILNAMNMESGLRNTLSFDSYVEVIKRMQDRIPERITYIQDHEDEEETNIKERLQFLVALYDRINTVNDDYYLPTHQKFLPLSA